MRNSEVKYWLISDTHFGHGKLVKEGLKSVNEDHEVLVSILRIVQSDDVLIHLGDVSFYNNSHWHDILRKFWIGKMILVRGNHDRKSLSWYYSYGWDFVCDEFKLNIYGKNLIFTHEPIDINYTDADINIHGHLHNDEHREKYVQTDHTRLVYNKITNLRKLVGK